MKANLLKIYLSFCSFFTIGILQGQPLEYLIQTAYEQNLELKILEKNYRSMLEVAPQVSQLPDPELGLGVFPLPVETRLGAQVARISAGQMLPWKGTLEAKKALAIAKAQPILKQIELKQLALRTQVEKAWLNWYELEQSRVVISKNKTLLKTMETLATTRVETGKGSIADVLKIQLKIQALESELLVLKEQQAQPLADLKNWLNLSEPPELSLSDSLAFSVLLYQKDSLFDQIQLNYPLFQQLKLEQEVANKALKVNELNSKPTFGVGLDYIAVTSRTDAFPENNGRDIIQLRGTMRIPLYKEQYRAKEREEQLKIEALELQKNAAANQILATLEKAYSEWNTVKIQFDLYNRQIETLRSTLEIIQKLYATDSKRFEELLTLQMEFVQYELMRLKTITKSHQIRLQIEQFVNF